MLTRYLIGTGMFPYDSDGDGTRESWASCYAATGNIADNGKGCGVTFVLDAATGVKELVLTAPNPYNQYESAERTPYRQLPPVVADLDGDGQVEIISGTDVFKFNGTTWSLAWRADLPGLTIFYEPFSISVADLDGDGTAEVVLHTAWYDGTGYHRGFLTYRHDGVLLHRFEVPMWDTGPVTIADVDGDGIPELLLVGRGLVWAYHADGTLVWASAIPDDDAALHPDDDPTVIHWPKPTGERTGAGNGLQVYDLDLDGHPEVIVSGVYRLAIFDGRTGAIKSSMHNNAYVRTNIVPLVVDANGDGHAEVISLAGDSGICGGCPSTNILAFSGVDRNWAPAPLVQNQMNFNPWAVNSSGGILYDGGVHRSFRTQKQLGTVTDPRTRDTATFTYAAVGNGGASAPATVSVQVMPQNSPPVITSTPPTALHAVPNGQGQYPTFVYQIAATDPDVGDTVHYEFVYSTINTAYFAQATVDPVTGVVRMYTGPCGGGGCDFGLMTFIVAAVDSFGARTEQGFVIDVTTQPRTVPTVVGQLQQPAKDAVEAVQLIPRVVEVFDARPVGSVVAQDPAAGTVVARSTTVLLSVSKGLQPIAMPFVVGKQLAQANAILANVGLSGNISTTFSATIPAGEVMTQSPAFGTLLDPANAPPVDLLVSAGGALPAPIASIGLQPGPGPFARLVGEDVQFKAVAILTDRTGADVSLKAIWTTTNAAVATVDVTGRVHAKIAGTATITAALSGKSGSITLNVAPLVPGDNTAPIAAITSPADGSDVIGPVPIVGTASDANFLRYELAISPAGDDTWTLLSGGTTAVTNGTLGTLDPSTYLNDLYTLRLTVFDRGQNETVATSTLQLKGNNKVGLFTLTYTDLNIPAAGIPLTVNRTYDSRDKAKGDFGIGWRLGLQTLRIRTNRVLGTGWVRTVSGATVTLNATSDHRVGLTLPDGRVEIFDMVVSPTSNLGSLDFTNVTGFTARPGTMGKLEALANNNLLIVNGGAEDELVDDATLEAYSPKLYRYTTLDGTQIEISPGEGVKKVTDPNGNAITFGPGGILHSDGSGIVFTRDAKQRIVAITDALGNVQTYAYDGNGDLVTHTNAVGGVSRFAYDLNHGLIEVRNALGAQVTRNEYDAAGRLIAMTDANGKQITFSHNDGAQEEIITDRLGSSFRLVYDAQGNVLQQERAVTIEGILVNAVTTATYDAQNNETSRVDPDGRRSTAAFSGVLLTAEAVDPAGLNLASAYAYNARNDVTSGTDPAGRTFSFTYSANGNVTGFATPLAGSGTSVPNAQGLPLQNVDALGNKAMFTYDAAGRVTREETFDAGSVLLRRIDSTYDGNGNRITSTLHRTVDGVSTPLTTQYTYDAANRLVAVTDPLGGISRTEYDVGGRVTAMIDPLGRRSSYSYDLLSRLSAITYPDATSESWTYDAESNVIATTDRAGRAMNYMYDELKRQVKVMLADGSSTQTVYSPGGRVAATIDAKGNRTDYAYDSAGRRIVTTLPPVANGISGPPLVRPQVSTALTSLGTPVSATDANGRITTFQYDANGRLTKTTHPDGSTQLQTWDALGRRASLTNEEGQTTTFGYDGLGRLVSVAGLAGSASYTYDQAGNLVTQTDALGRVTRYRYDALNRLVEKTYPGGNTERYTFDAVGNLVAHVDGLGRTTTYTYNVMNKLVAKSLPGAVTIAYGYKPDGQRASVTDPRGVTSYSYDSVGRLASITHPSGEVVSYARDANGNLLSLASPAATLNYGYDALNRLLQVNSPEGQSNSFYDLVGNRVRQTAANGIVTDVNYDNRNRPASLTHRNAGNVVLQSFTNAYSPAGRRSSVTEQDGSIETYSYDGSGRLSTEVRTGSAPHNIAHTYDAVGNRTQLVRSGAPTTFTYNADDQLVADGASSYTYDANGNLVTRASGSTTTQFGYDAENRLSTVLDGGVVNQYTYDADGNRVSASTSGGLTRYLVDRANPTGFTQVLEERNGGGALQARYSYGNELLAMAQGGSASFYLRDAHGSTRGLANGAATVTDRYTYDAYGNTVAATGSTANAYRYDGERLDGDTGLYQLRDRYYNPALGRFMSRDPFSGRTDLPVSRHRYQFANSDPVNFVDPSGRESLAELSFVQGLQSMLNVSYGVQTVGQFCNLVTQVEQAKTAMWVSDVLIRGAIAGVGVFGVLQAISGGTFKGTLDTGFESAELSGPRGLKKLGMHAKGGPGTFGFGFGFDFHDRPSIKADFGIYPPPVTFTPQFSLSEEIVIKEFKFCGDHGVTLGKAVVKGELGLGASGSIKGISGTSGYTMGLEATLFRGAFKFGYPLMTITYMPELKFESILGP